VSPLVLKGHEGEVLAATIDANTRWLCTGSSDKTARLWRLNDDTGKESPIVLQGHDNPVTAVQFSADCNWLVTSCGKPTTTGADYKALLWSIDANGVTTTPIVLSDHSQSANWRSEFNTTDVATFSPDCRWLIRGGGLMLLLCDLNFDSLLTAARQRAGRVLTRAERRRFLPPRMNRSRAAPRFRSTGVDSVSQTRPINQPPIEPQSTVSPIKAKDVETRPAEASVSRKASDAPPVAFAASEERANISQSAAVAAIKKLGGRVTFDEENPGKPVVNVLLSNNKVAAAGLAQLKGLTSLRGLYLDRTRMTDAGLVHLKEMTALQTLVLKGHKVTDAGLEHLKALKSLEMLTLEGEFYSSRGATLADGNKVTDAGLAHLQGLTNLQTLILRGIQMTSAGLAHLKGLTSLQRLELDRTMVGDAGLGYLKGLKNLHTLGLDHTMVTDVGLEHLKGLASLRTLNLSFAQVTNAGLMHLKTLMGLEMLHLDHTMVTDAGLEHLKGMASLRTLNLSGTEVTDVGLEHLKGLASLSTLYLDHTMATDAGLGLLKGMANLRTLNLSGTEVTDAGLEHLKGLTGLRTLFLDHTMVTDAGLEHLKGMTNLKVLHIQSTDVFKLREAQAKSVNSALPECRCFTSSLTGNSVNSGHLTQLSGSYHLRENEAVRFFPPPYPEVRSRIAELLRRAQTMSAPSYSLFLQSRGETLLSNPLLLNRGNFTLADILQRTMKLPTDSIVDPDGLLGFQLEGDLVSSADASSDDLMRQLEDIFSKSTGDPIKLEYIGIPTHTLVLEGELRSSDDGMKLSSIIVRDKESSGFTRGSFIRKIEGLMGMPVIDETSEKVASELSITIPIWDDGLTQSRLKNVLDSISQQSGLTANIEEREIPRLKIAISDD
jgi:internalin A